MHIITKHITFLFSCCFLLGVVSCERNTPTNPADSKQGSIGTTMQKSAKRGVGFKFSRTDDTMLLAPFISWNYNWGPDMTSEAAIKVLEARQIDFCPMAWNGNYNTDRIKKWVSNHPTCKYLLAFNEPNLTDQAKMTPTEAADKWTDLKALANELGLKIVSPAMNYGTLAGYSDPIKWLDEFFACPEVSLNDICAISIHCYMGVPSGVKNYIEMFAKYGKPIWITEFCGWDGNIGSVDAQIRYMCDVINYMEMSEIVERYAWFIPRAAMGLTSYPYMQLLDHETPSSLTDLGKIFGAISTFDKSVWLNVKDWVQPNLYTNLTNTDLYIYPTTDDIGDFMVTNFGGDQQITYQIGAETHFDSLCVRYASNVKGHIKVSLDGVLKTEIDIPRTGGFNQWSTIKTYLPLEAGKYRLTLQAEDTNIRLNGFRWE